MFNFLLGVADQQSNSQAVTEQKFTELENSIYERMKDVQDMAHTIQSDQITFLNDQITTFYTIIGIAVAVLTALGGWAIASIRKANSKAEEHMNKAEEHMELATLAMKNAENLSQEAKKNIKLLQEEQANLRILLDSKDLDAKLNNLERTAEITSRLELQMKASTHLQQANFLMSKSTEIYRDPVYEEVWKQSKEAFHQRTKALAEIERLNYLLKQMQNELNLFGSNPDYFNKKQVEKEASNLREQASKIHTASQDFYFNYVLPVLEREYEKGD